MHRIVCAVDQSLYYQLLCKGLLRSLLQHQPRPCSLTVLLDGDHCQPLNDLRDRIEIVAVKPLDIVCGCVSSRTTFARLDVPYLFPNDQRVLYLDVDTFATQEVSELFHLPFDTLAAVVPGRTLTIEQLVQREFKTNIHPMEYTLDHTVYSCGTENHRYFNAGTSNLRPVSLMNWCSVRCRCHAH